MNEQQVQGCIDVLETLAKGFAAKSDSSATMALEGLTCVQAQGLVIQYAALRSCGMTHERALTELGGQTITP